MAWVELSLRTVYMRRWGLVAPVAVGVRISAAARARARKSGGCRREGKRNGESNEGSQCWTGDDTSRKSGLGSWKARFSMFCEGVRGRGPRPSHSGLRTRTALSRTSFMDVPPMPCTQRDRVGVQKCMEARCAGCAGGGLGPAGGLAHLRLRDDRSCQGEGWWRWRWSRAI
jgi:hypothetical protein